MLRHGWMVPCVALLIGHGTLVPAYGQLMNFDDLPAGTLFGIAAGDAPTDVVYSRNGISMAVDTFFLGTFVGFYRAEVDGVYAAAFNSPALELNNIAVSFAFDQVGFPVTDLTFDYMEFGGAVNIGVNGMSPLQLASMTDLPFILAPGVSATVSAGTVSLTAPAGAITSLQVGGQELMVDNLLVVPEPVTTGLLLAGAGLWGWRRSKS